MSNQFGCFKAGIASLAEEKRWPVERYMNGFAEGLEMGFFEYDAKNLVLFLPEFTKYNHPANPNVILSWFKSFYELPSSPLKDKFCWIFKGYLKGFGEGFHKAFDDTFGKSMAKQEQEQ